MKSKLCLILLGMSTMLGCTRTARFYPVQGPLSAQTPLPIAVGKISASGPTQSRGSVSVVLTDGEALKGSWVLVPREQAPKVDTTAALTTAGMQPEWDTVYGAGYYVAHVLGTRLYAHSTITGDRGTVLQVEFYKSGEEGGGKVAVAVIKGVAKDNKDNIYKVLLQ